MEELDLKYLQYALAVVRYGSVTQAARALYLAQPNLSRAIGELEQSLGFPLFLRTRQGMSLTPQGERFLTEVETLLDRLSDLARECRQESRRRVHFACVPSSLFVNTVLETARGLPDWSIQCEEYYDCRELFDRVMDLNVKGMFHCARGAVPWMERQGRGVILNTSSIVSFYGQPAGVAYPVSKFAVNGFTLSLARELAPKGIRVNAVAPGIIETDMLRAVPREVLAPLEAQIPLGRVGQPGEVAEAFVFLASEQASYITGVVLRVDGLARA